MKIKNTITRIEDGTLPWAEWNHYNHLLLAFYYVFTEENLFLALSKIRCALIRYGALVNQQSACQLRYNETMTMFWILEVQKFIQRHPGKPIEQVEVFLSQSELVSKGYIDKYYSSEVLSSPKAIATYIPPSN